MPPPLLNVAAAAAADVSGNTIDVICCSCNLRFIPLASASKNLFVNDKGDNKNKGEHIDFIVRGN